MSGIIKGEKKKTETDNIQRCPGMGSTLKNGEKNDYMRLRYRKRPLGALKPIRVGVPVTNPHLTQPDPTSP